LQTESNLVKPFSAKEIPQSLKNIYIKIWPINEDWSINLPKPSMHGQRLMVHDVSNHRIFLFETDYVACNLVWTSYGILE
jgi:hypothetical protein